MAVFFPCKKIIYLIGDKFTIFFNLKNTTNL
jgi:hypothetical protein